MHIVVLQGHTRPRVLKSGTHFKSRLEKQTVSKLVPNELKISVILKYGILLFSVPQ